MVLAKGDLNDNVDGDVTGKLPFAGGNDNGYVDGNIDGYVMSVVMSTFTSMANLGRDIIWEVLGELSVVTLTMSYRVSVCHFVSVVWTTSSNIER